MSFRKTFLPAIVLSVICLVAALALGVTNRLTADKIARVERERYYASAEAVLPAGVRLAEIDRADVTGFVATDEWGATVGYAIKSVARGYGGDVTCVVGFDMAGRVIGLSVSAPDETPGLGNNVEKTGFTSQFVGMDTAPVLGENVDAVTGASYSSRAVTDAVSSARRQLEILLKGA